MFLVLENAKKIVEITTDLLDAVRPLNPKLADQIDRASTSVLFNLAEGNRRTGYDKLRLFRYAEGSAAELEVALFSVRARRIRFDLTVLEDLVGQEVRMLYRLTRSPKLGSSAA